MHGTITSVAEVTHVLKHGFWLLLSNEALLVPFGEFPWFRKATIEQLLSVEWPSKNHLYWPQLDIDLSVESIRDPKAFPLTAKGLHLPSEAPWVLSQAILDSRGSRLQAKEA